jgi:hypothetical protein
MLAGLQIEMALLQCEDFALVPPAERVLDVDHDLEIRRQMLPHRLILVVLEEPLSRGILLQLPDHWESEDLAGGIPQPKQADELPECTSMAWHSG